MIISVIIILLLASTCTYLGYRVWYLAGVLADQQDEVDSFVGYISNLEETNQYMYNQILKSYNAMQQIDRLGAFEKDDESGTTFQLLKQTIDELKEEFDGTQEEN